MKKILLVAFIISSVHCISQDFEKGDKLFGGSFSFSVFNVNNTGPAYYNAGNAGLLPSYAWFIKKNLALGVRGNINYSRSVTRQTIGDKRINTSFAIGPSVFLKKYRPLKEKFGVYFDNEVGFNYEKIREKTGPSALDSKSFGASYKFSPGVFYRFSKRFIGEGNIGGVYASYYGDGNDNNIFGIGASFLQYFNLGVNYVIEKRKS